MSEQPSKRYPIGQFEYGETWSIAQSKKHIQILAEFPRKLKKLLKKMSNLELDTPYRRGGWTVRQVVHHLADSHVNAYIRMKMAVTETLPVIKPYEESKWAELEDGKDSGVKISVKLLKALHERWVNFLSALTTEDLELAYYHPGLQRSVPLEESIALYVWHSNHHLAHIHLVADVKEDKKEKSGKKGKKKSGKKHQKPKSLKLVHDPNIGIATIIPKKELEETPAPSAETPAKSKASKSAEQKSEIAAARAAAKAAKMAESAPAPTAETPAKSKASKNAELKAKIAAARAAAKAAKTASALAARTGAKSKASKNAEIKAKIAAARAAAKAAKTASALAARTGAKSKASKTAELKAKIAAARAAAKAAKTAKTKPDPTAETPAKPKRVMSEEQKAAMAAGRAAKAIKTA